jgi:hypothetical protein
VHIRNRSREFHAQPQSAQVAASVRLPLANRAGPICRYLDLFDRQRCDLLQPVQPVSDADFPRGRNQESDTYVDGTGPRRLGAAGALPVRFFFATCFSRRPLQSAGRGRQVLCERQLTKRHIDGAQHTQFIVTLATSLLVFVNFD